MKLCALFWLLQLVLTLVDTIRNQLLMEQDKEEIIQEHQEDKIEESSLMDLLAYLDSKKNTQKENIIKTVADLFPALHFCGVLPRILGKAASSCLSGAGGVVSGVVTTGQLYSALA